MKLYAIVEIEDEMFDDYKEWYISADGLDIRYEDDGCLMVYKCVKDALIELKPLPQKKNTEISLNAINDWLEHSERLGFNACLDEILGERK